MRDICTEEVIQHAEHLLNLTDPQNKFDGNIFAIRDTILEKIKQAEDLSSEILNLFREDNDFIGVDALTTKFLIFTKKKLLDIAILKSSDLKTLQKKSFVAPFNKSFNKMNLPKTEIQLFDGQSMDYME